MSANYTGDRLSNEQIANLAYRLRRHHGLEDVDVPDVAALLKRDTLLTRFGLKGFDYQVVGDEVLGGDEAVTLITPKHVRVRVSRTTYDGALALDRRSRMTIAHEFMHGVLHRNEEPLARARAETQKRVVPAYVSVERQASFGASEYLITAAMVQASDTPADLAARAVVSFTSADIRWEKEQTRLGRAGVMANLLALSVELRSGPDQTRNAASSALPCPRCGHETLFPIGSMYLCTGPCDRVIGEFPDGDGPMN